jgi:predicted DNA binding protein
MSVILEVTVPAEAFEIGRILSIPTAGSLTLETLVPLGERAMPFVRLHSAVDEEFQDQIEADRRVATVEQVSAHNGERLYALDWDVSDEEFFEAITETKGHVLEATGTAAEWQFRLRFPSHEQLSAFHDRIKDADIPVSVSGVYNPTKPDVGPWYGLTDEQRVTLKRAVQTGYYDIPRKISTSELAEEFDISDQAVTERLRRAISTLVTNTLLAPEQER